MIDETDLVEKCGLTTTEDGTYVTISINCSPAIIGSSVKVISTGTSDVQLNYIQVYGHYHPIGISLNMADALDESNWTQVRHLPPGS